MTQPTWHFREFRPGDNVSDPDFARALFSRDDPEVAKSLVRESVQNSLDARCDHVNHVHVRFAIRTDTRAATSASARFFFDGLWPHIEASDAGVEEPPRKGDPIPYLVVEDFGTKGLTGNPLTWDPFEAQTNSFFLFFRALGRSGKEGEDRGRWGVGKFVFPMTSRAHSLLALTIPENGPGSLLMGRSVLKAHRAGRTTYHPDGHWGVRTENSLVVPVTEADVVAELTRIFDLRRSTETGLSVVVPWVPKGMTGEAIVTAAAGEYFLPILRGELRVEVDDNGQLDTINSSRLIDISSAIKDAVVRARVMLGIEAATWPAAQLLHVTRPSERGDYDWGVERLTTEQRQLIAAKLDAGAVVGLRVLTTVRSRSSGNRDSYFDVFIKQVTGLGRVRPLIIREGVAISEDKTSVLQDHAALIIVDDAPLATFVGDAETPAHSELQNDLVKAKYILAGKLIALLRSAPAAIMREVEGSDKAADRSLLAEFFPRLEAAPMPKKPKRKESKEGDEVPEIPPLPTRQPRFRIGKIDSGFTVVGTGTVSVGAQLIIQCAYDVRRGNPLRKYRELDFVVGRDVNVTASGIAIESLDANRIVGEVEDPQFEIQVDGFDANRNVFVRVTVNDSAAES